MKPAVSICIPLTRNTKGGTAGYAKRSPLCAWRLCGGIEAWTLCLRFPLSDPERVLGKYFPDFSALVRVPPFRTGKGARGIGQPHSPDGFSAPLPHSLWGRGRGLGLCSSIYLRNSLLVLPFGSIDDHPPRRNRIRFNIDYFRARSFSLNLTSLVDGDGEWRSSARHSHRKSPVLPSHRGHCYHRGLSYRGLRPDNFVGSGYLSRRRAAILVVRLPDLELEFQSAVAEEIHPGMPHGLGWRQLVLVPVFRWFDFDHLPIIFIIIDMEHPVRDTMGPNVAASTKLSGGVYSMIAPKPVGTWKCSPNPDRTP